ncbi:GFA family protein [Marinibaculum pumilum]|uniref:GFA family protein n=1 Tax=Marinibaculum pumilum TaxID=1766165 RepID=A0ABV7L2A2_9PROT
MSETDGNAASGRVSGVRRGSCACGAVRFEVAGPLRPIIACHCGQCRKMSGHFTAATEVPEARLRLLHEEGLRWYASSAKARRAFCGTCGSTLFFKLNERDHVAVFAGALDDVEGLSLAGQIHAADAAGYYRVPDDLPQLERAAIDALPPQG